MSTVAETMDLSLYGCPMHYIKAREALGSVDAEQSLLFIVNNGEALQEIVASLSKDGHKCDVQEQETLTTTIRVTKKL
jgi:TusA-related sulfurtransferase